jgi:ankyrin repeat protein
MFNLGKRWKLIMVYVYATIFSLSNFAVAEPLDEAAKERDLAKVKSLIAEGSDVNVGDENGLTPLHLAAYRGHKDVAELLILNGANVNAVTTGKGWSGTKWTPLGYTIYKGRKDIAELLILNGANVNYADNDKRSTYLHLAAHKGDKDIAELLILNGANVNAADKTGANPLNLAEQEGHKEVVVLLIKNGAHE